MTIILKSYELAERRSYDFLCTAGFTPSLVILMFMPWAQEGFVVLKLIQKKGTSVYGSERPIRWWKLSRCLEFTLFILQPSLTIIVDL